MGPKKRRGRKQSLESKSVVREASETATLVSGDYEEGVGEVHLVPPVDGEEVVAQVAPAVVSDKKLSSAVLVLENCLLTPSQQQPRNSFASSVAVEEVQQSPQPERRRKALGIRRGAVKKAQAEEGSKAVACGNSEEKPKPKQRIIKKQKRKVAQRIPRRRVDMESPAAATAIEDEPTSDVDVESPLLDGNICVEMERSRTGNCPTGQEKASVSETFLVKRKRKRAYKKERHSTKRRQKDETVVAKEEEDQEQEIKVDDEEEEKVDDEEEGENCATWMVSPLSGDEERMIFKRQRKVLLPDSETGSSTVECLVPVSDDAAADFVGSVPDSKLPDAVVFADPMEADAQEDVELTCPNDDNLENTNFTALTTKKERRNKKGKANLKRAVSVTDQPASEIAMAVTEGLGVRNQKRTRLTKKSLKLQEVHEGQVEVADKVLTESRVTRSRRNGNGNGARNGNGDSGKMVDCLLPDDKQTLLNKKTAEETELLLPGYETFSNVEADPLEGPTLQVNSTDGNFVKETSSLKVTAINLQTNEGGEEGKATVEESKKTKRMASGEELPNSACSEDDRSSGASVRSSDADGDELVENALKDGIACNNPAVTCVPVSCQSFDRGFSESAREFGEVVSSISDDVNVTSKNSILSETLCATSDVSEQNKECSNLAIVIPAQQVAGDATSSSVVALKDGDSEASDDSLSVQRFRAKQRTVEEIENDESLSSGTQMTSIQSEQCVAEFVSMCSAKELQNTSQTIMESRSMHSASVSIVGESTEEKADICPAQATTAASVLPSLAFRSEVTCEAVTKSDSDQFSFMMLMSGANVSSDGAIPRDVATVPMYVLASQGKVQAVMASDGDSSKIEEAKEGEREAVDRDEENLSCMSSAADIFSRDDCATTNKKAEQGVGCVGSSDDTGYVPLKKRRLRMPETVAEAAASAAAAAADSEKQVPSDVLTSTSSDLPNPSYLVPSNNAETSTIIHTEGPLLCSTAPDLLTLALPCPKLVPKANKYVGIHAIAAGDLAGAVIQASQWGARALGIFIKPQKTWTPPPLDPEEAVKFKKALEEKGYSPHMVVPHGSYLLNCGAFDADHLQKSRESLVDDLKRCQMLGIPLFNFHPGACSDSDTVDACLIRVADSINYVHSRVADIITVIENMSGEANTVGSTFAELKQIIDGVVDKSRVGVCLDTCHAFAAGYNLRNEAGYRKMMDEFEKTIGRQYLKAVHINDSQGDLGSRVDHHEALGKGKIGLTCFRLIMCDSYLENIPLILETPVAGQKGEIELLYSFTSRMDRMCGSQDEHQSCSRLNDLPKLTV